jgi:hypothetical protein
MVQEIAMPSVGNASAPYHPSVLVLRILMANPKEFSLKVPDPHQMHNFDQWMDVCKLYLQQEYDLPTLLSDLSRDVGCL